MERWKIVSTYDDGGHDLRIVECYVLHNREAAERIAQQVREIRAGQTQGPVVTIEST